MELIELLGKAVKANCSDVFIVPGAPVTGKAHGHLVTLTDSRMLPAMTLELIGKIYELAFRKIEQLDASGDDDFSLTIRDLSRFRCNVYKQRGTVAATLRVVTFGLPDPKAMGIPQQVMDLAKLHNGMVLVTGPAGSGKSTTLACLIDAVNQARDGHIVTIEEPIEFLHSHKKSLVSQREIPCDAPTFARALRSVLRQSPDVIMLGEMRDLETIQTALTAAETGHMLYSSLHTIGASKTIDRIVDSFPAGQQQQIRVQLSMVLRAVVSQQLVPTLDGKRVPLFEVMTVTPAIQNLIRDGRTYQIDNVAHGNGIDSLSTDNELFRMYKARQIDKDTALTFAVNPDTLRKRLL